MVLDGVLSGWLEVAPDFAALQQKELASPPTTRILAFMLQRNKALASTDFRQPPLETADADR
jgi:hypothetical protein